MSIDLERFDPLDRSSLVEKSKKGKDMRNAKDAVRKILDEIPEDSSLQDIQYHIYVLEKVEKGLQDAQEKKTISQAEVKKRMSKWLGK